jgi:Chaperone of endosialidase
MNNSKVQILIEEVITNVILESEPIVIDAQLAVPQIGSGNYLFSDQDTYKTDGFLRFLQSKQLQFVETGVSSMHGEAGVVYLDLGGADFKIRDNATERFSFSRATGDFTAQGDVAAYSDKRLKFDIKPIENALEKIKQLNGVTFNKHSDPYRRSTGLIAQDVEKVLPEAIHYDDSGYLSVAYGNLIGLLVEAIKELTGVIENDNKCRCSHNKA